MATIAVIGVGLVGSAIAQALLIKNVATELILYDQDRERCLGELLDLSDILGFSSCSSLIQGTPEDLKRADIIIIAAGRRQKPGESRYDLIHHNTKIVSDVLVLLNGVQEHTKIIMVSNPLDTLTLQALRGLDLSPNQVFGSGTYLDTLRLKRVLSQKTGVSGNSIDALIIGEHGDSQCIVWTATRIAQQPVELFGIDNEQQTLIESHIKDTAQSIITNKGATYYGIAEAVADISWQIVFNTHRVVPVSWYHESSGVCMSLPAQISFSGIERILPPVLSHDEQVALEKSILVLKEQQKIIDD